MIQRKNRRFVQSVDTETGEIMDGVAVYISAKARWHQDFFMGIQDAFAQLAREPRMTFEARRVLDYCLSRMGWENHIHIPQREIAEALGMKQPHVSRAMKLLVEIAVLLEGPKIGRSKSYRLNSNYAWKGKIKNLSTRRVEEYKREKESSKDQAHTVLLYAMGGSVRQPDESTPTDETTENPLDAFARANPDFVDKVYRENPVTDDSWGKGSIITTTGEEFRVIGWDGDEPILKLDTMTRNIERQKL